MIRFVSLASTGLLLAALALPIAPPSIASPQVSSPAPPAHRSGALLQKVDSAAGDEARFAIDLASVHALLQQPVGSGVRVTLPLSAELSDRPGGSVALTLRRFEVVAPDARFLIGRAGKRAASHQMSPPRILLLRGEIEGETGSRAFLAIDERGFGSGSISGLGGPTLIIAADRANPAAPALIIRRGELAIPEFDDFCQVIVEGAGGAGGGGEGGIAGDPPVLADPARGPRLLRVAVDADQSYTQLFADLGQAQSYIVQVIAAVSDIYERDLDLRLQLAFSRLWPAGGEPFSASSLGGFRTHWQDNEDMTGLNLIHMFSARRDLNYGGVAYLVSGCSSSAFGISGFMLGGFAPPPAGGPGGAPHLDNWDIVVVAHEMGHNLGTPHTHDYSPPIDSCAIGQNKRGSIMSYCHIRPGGLYNIDVHMHARVAAFIAENNPADLDSCLFHDCNGNGIDDADDIVDLFSLDSNANGIPDECEDCNSNGVLDPNDIAASTSLDVNGNAIPDECEPDCDSDGVPDDHEIATAAATDVNGNFIPDACEPDCDSNGIADFQDILNGAPDLDRDSRPDVCNDCDGNGSADWFDLNKQRFVYIGQTGASLREYHGRSGVLVSEIGTGVLNGAHDMVFGPDGALYVTSFNDHRVVRFDVEAGTWSEFIAAGTAGLANPSALLFTPAGNLLVASQSNDNVLQFDGATGAFIGEFIGAPSPEGGSPIDMPWDLAYGPDANLYIVTGPAGVLKFDGASGAFLGVFIQPEDTLINPRAILFLPDLGQVFVTDRTANAIKRFDGVTGALLGQFNDLYPLIAPWGIARGPNGNVYAARTTVGEVRLIEYDLASGRYLRSFVRGDNSLTAPTSFAFRAQSPNDQDGNDRLDACDAALCPADINGDLTVDVNDLLLLIGAWGSADGPSDLNDDGVVDVNDLLLLVGGWGEC